MKERKMKPEELYLMVDVDKNKIVELKELTDVITTLSDFTKKEIKSIYEFYDIN